MNLRERARLAYLDQIEADEFELLIAKGPFDGHDHDAELQTFDRELGSGRSRSARSPTVRSVVGPHRTDSKAGRSLTWEDTDTEVYVHRLPTDFPVQSLADLGGVLRDDPLDEDEADQRHEAEATARARLQQSYGLIRGPVANPPRWAGRPSIDTFLDGPRKGSAPARRSLNGLGLSAPMRAGLRRRSPAPLRSDVSTR